jgi:hypothetical protein
MAMTLQAEVMVKDYREAMAGSPAEKSVMEIYIAGVGSGINWANVLATTRKQPFYCQPEKLLLGTSDKLDIINREIEGASARINNLDTWPIGVLLLDGLMKKFPCTNPTSLHQRQRDKVNGPPR